jgi:hypothetical protein
MIHRLTLLAVLALASCASKNVWVDSDDTFDFTGRRTYAWIAGAPAPSDITQGRIEAGVDAWMAARGLQRVESGAADLKVATFVGGRSEVRSTGSSATVGVSRGTSRGRVGMGTTMGPQVYEVAIGTLVVEISDGETERVVWRARAEKSLSNDPQKNAVAIEEALEKAFAEFPPE